MKRTRSCWVGLLAAGLAAAVFAAPAGDWTFLSTSTIGASDYLKAHPDWDGRGVLIAVCDSGVDLGLPGLMTTPDGGPKILDARVFCDEGKVDLEPALFGADDHGKAVHGKDGRWLYGLDSQGVKPAKDDDVLVAYFKESDFKNSDAQGGDLNGNGTTEDVYGLVVFPVKEGDASHWVAYLDTNADGNLADETLLKDFSESRQAFALRGRDAHAQAAVMTFALNLWPKEKKAALYMADGSHGTHVSGICAGYAIDGQAGYNGIAPGARILALKIGNNTLSGGSTTPGSMVAAWRYAVKRARELDMPLVIQMSYGVGSENEGSSVAEKLLDTLLDENPGVVATVSAGNEGPGISTVGLPSCMTNALSVGAVLNKDSAKDLYGVTLAQNEMFSFSSRGAEAAKPDVVCPGFSASTVPNYEEGRNVFRGTSMASPQAAGACALLLSAARASGLPIRRDLVMAAVERGASPMAGYGPLDVGAGLLNVPRAWEIYQALAKRGVSVLRYTAETESPEMVSGTGPAIHWRGAYFPDAARTQTVTVKPLFPSDMSADAQARFFAGFDLSCTADWLRIDKSSAFMKAESPLTIPVTFDASRLKRPGLYQGEILGFLKGGGSNLGPDFRVPVSVVVPEGFAEGAGFSFAKRVEGLKPAKVERTFVRIPPSAGAAAVELEVPQGQQGAVAAYLFDPEGREAGFAVLRPGSRKTTLTLGNADLAPGVWELDLYANYANRNAVSVSMEAQALALGAQVEPRLPVRLSQGQAPKAEVEVLSGMGSVLRGSASGEIVGTVSDKTQRLSSSDWERTFSVAPGESGVTFRLSISPEDFGKFTDIAVQIKDADGKALASDGLSYRKTSVDFTPPASAKAGARYTLSVAGATADPDDDGPSWSLRVVEIHRFADPVALAVKQGKARGVTLYPDHAARLSLEAASVPPALPDGAAWMAEVTFKSGDKATMVLPLELMLGKDK